MQSNRLTPVLPYSAVHRAAAALGKTPLNAPVCKLLNKLKITSSPKPVLHNSPYSWCNHFVPKDSGDSTISDRAIDRLSPL